MARKTSAILLELLGNKSGNLINTGGVHVAKLFFVIQACQFSLSDIERFQWSTMYALAFFFSSTSKMKARLLTTHVVYVASFYLTYFLLFEICNVLEIIYESKKGFADCLGVKGLYFP